jgi:hypothetical protein
MVIFFSNIGFNWTGIFINRGPVLVDITTLEAIKIFKARSGGPEIEGSGRRGLPVGNIVILTKP